MLSRHIEGCRRSWGLSGTQRSLPACSRFHARAMPKCLLLQSQPTDLLSHLPASDGEGGSPTAPWLLPNPTSTEHPHSREQLPRYSQWEETPLSTPALPCSRLQILHHGWSLGSTRMCPSIGCAPKVWGGTCGAAGTGVPSIQPMAWNTSCSSSPEGSIPRGIASIW